VRSFYENSEVQQLMQNLSDTLRVVSLAGIEVNDSLTNLIFVVFASFFPEIQHQVEFAVKKKEEQKRLSEERKQ